MRRRVSRMRSAKENSESAANCGPCTRHCGCIPAVRTISALLRTRLKRASDEAKLASCCRAKSAAVAMLVASASVACKTIFTRRDPQRGALVARFRGSPRWPAKTRQTQRAAAAPLSSGRVLKAMAAFGAARRMALTTASNRTSRFGGRRTPPPITTQS